MSDEILDAMGAASWDSVRRRVMLRPWSQTDEGTRRCVTARMLALATGAREPTTEADRAALEVLARFREAVTVAEPETRRRP